MVILEEVVVVGLEVAQVSAQGVAHMLEVQAGENMTEGMVADVSHRRTAGDKRNRTVDGMNTAGAVE